MKTDISYGIIPVHSNEKKELRFLLVQHTAGHWAFPKGHGVKGETEIETAQRELAEETSITDCEILKDSRLEESYIISTDIVSNHKQYGEEVRKTVVYVIGVVKNAHVDISNTHGEIQNYTWLPYTQAFEKITFKESKDILVKAITFLTNKII